MGGGKTSTGTSTVSIPPEVLARYNAVNTQAQTAANTPFQPYSYNPNAFVAPLTPTQQAGIANTNTAAGAAQPFYQVAAGQTMASGQPINGQQIGQYMSPFLGSVVGSESALLNQNNQQAMAGQLGNAIQSGAFGGDRSGVAAANLAQQQNLANANIYSGLLNQGYNTALQTAEQQQGVGLSAAQQLAGLGTEAQSAALQGAQAQLAAGQAEQQTGQAGLTALYNQFLQQQSYPFQTAQFLANIAEGTGALSGSTTTAQQPGGFLSDERLKEDIEPVGMTFDGQKIYKYRYKGEDKTQIGLLAGDVERKHPHAVGLAAGYKTVDYDKATKHAVDRGHFQRGGLAARSGFEYGGVPNAGGPYYNDPSLINPFDMGAILQAQEQSFAPFSQSGRGMSGVPGSGAGYVPQANLPVGHLATAEIPQQRESGLAAAASAADQMKKLGDAASSASSLVPDSVKDYVGNKYDQMTGAANSSSDPKELPDAPGVQHNADGSLQTAGGGIDSLMSRARGGNVIPFPHSGLAAHRRHRDDGGAMPYQGAGPAGLDIPNDNPQSKLATANAPGAGQSGLGQLAGIAGGLGSLVGAGKTLMGAAGGIGSMMSGMGGLGSLASLALLSTGGTADRKGYSGKDGSSVTDDGTLSSDMPFHPGTYSPPVEDPNAPDPTEQMLKRTDAQVNTGLNYLGSGLASGANLAEDVIGDTKSWRNLSNAAGDLWHNWTTPSDTDKKEILPTAQPYPGATPPETLSLPNEVNSGPSGPSGHYESRGKGVIWIPDGQQTGVAAGSGASPAEKLAVDNYTNQNSTPLDTHHAGNFPPSSNITPAGVADSTTGASTAPSAVSKKTGLGSANTVGQYSAGYPDNNAPAPAVGATNQGPAKTALAAGPASISSDVANMRQQDVAPGAGNNVGLGSIKQPPESFASKIGDIAGGFGHWMTQKQNAIPLLEFLGAMGTAPTRSLGVALASGAIGAASGLRSQQEYGLEQQRTDAEVAVEQGNAMTGAFFKSPTGAPLVRLANGQIVNQAEWLNMGRPAVWGAPTSTPASGTISPSSMTIPSTSAVKMVSQATNPSDYTYQIGLGPVGQSTLQQEAKNASQAGYDSNSASKNIEEYQAQATTAQNNRQQILDLASSLMRPNGFMATGNAADARQDALGVVNLVGRIFGFGSVDENDLASGQISTKLTNWLSQAQAKNLGETALGALSDLKSGLVTQNMSPKAVKQILADMLMQSQKQIDEGAYAAAYQNAGSNLGLNLGARVDQAFNADHGQDNYRKERNIIRDKFFDPAKKGFKTPIEYVSGNSGDPVREAMFQNPTEFEKNYGPGMFRYFSSRMGSQ